MKIVKQGYEILYPHDSIFDNLPTGLLNWEDECRLIEQAGRTAYKSEGIITNDSYKRFVEMIIKRGHEAVLEFGNMVVHFVTDRGISHELVRHRLCSCVQESTRYCNYSKDKFGNELSFIRPSFPCQDPDELNSSFRAWKAQMEESEQQYLLCIKEGWQPQQARSILPNCTKTEVVVKANFREWRHIFKLRAISKAAHPDMRKLMIPLYEQCRKECPVVFDMGEVE